MVQELVVLVAAGVIVALVVAGVPVAWRWWRERSAPTLTGAWDSAFVPVYGPNTEIVQEKVLISRTPRGLHIANLDRNAGIHWETSHLRILKGRQLIGEWRSWEQDGDASGGFVLTWSPVTNMIYGWWLGPDTAAGQWYSPWVMVRDGQTIEAAFQALRTWSKLNGW